MARSILPFVCLSFLLMQKFIAGDAPPGNIGEASETNIQSTINQTPSLVKLTPANIFRNIKPLDTDTIKSTLEIPKTIEIKGRIVNTPPKKPGPPAPAPTAGTKKIKYKLGNRVAGNRIFIYFIFILFREKVHNFFVSGDRLVASNVLSQQWPVAQNVTQNLNYPKGGAGSLITYIEIIVEQVNLVDTCLEVEEKVQRRKAFGWNPKL